MKMSDLKIMKMKPQIILLLVLAVSFQSISSVTDIHQSHQSGVEHLEFEHDHEDESVSKSQDETNSFDCHHCCHCHGGTSYYLDNKHIGYVYFWGYSNLLDNFTLFKNRTTSPNFRPPIV